MDDAELPRRAGSFLSCGQHGARPELPQSGATGEDGRDVAGAQRGPLGTRHRRWLARGRVSGIRLPVPASRRAHRATQRGGRSHPDDGTSAPASYAGKHYVVRDAYCEPRPSPPPPILIGGGGPKLMRVAAAKADAWVWDGPLEIYQPPYQRLVDNCEQIGRPHSEIKLAEFDAYFPADRADFPEPQPSGYLDFMTS